MKIFIRIKGIVVEFNCKQIPSKGDSLYIDFQSDTAKYLKDRGIAVPELEPLGLKVKRRDYHIVQTDDDNLRFTAEELHLICKVV